MVQYEWKGDTGIGAIVGNVWSRSARRKVQSTSRTQDEDVKLGFRVQVKDMGQQAQVDVEWRLGVDAILFESLCGKLKSIVQQNHHVDLGSSRKIKSEE